MNVYSAVKYVREILRNSSGDKVMVDRAKLRALVIATEGSPRFARERRIALTLGPSTERE